MVTGTGWQRVADELRHRRLSLGYRTRAALAAHLAETEGSGVARILGALENAERDNYKQDTLTRAEGWYGLPHGQIRAWVDGATQPEPEPPVGGDHAQVMLTRRAAPEGIVWTLTLHNGSQAVCTLPTGSTPADFAAEVTAMADDIAWTLGVDAVTLRETVATIG